jgi:hypothetical protein
MNNKRIAALARVENSRLRAEIAGLEAKIDSLNPKLCDPREENEAGISPKPATGQKDDASQEQSTLVSEIQPLPANCNQSQYPWYKKWRSWNWRSWNWQWWKLRLETLAIPFVMAYATVTVFQWNDLRDNFAVEQRAWISIDTPAQTPVVVGQPYLVTFQFDNTGKTTARHIRGTMTVKLLGENEELILNETGKVDTSELTNTVRIPLINPGQKSPPLQAAMIHWTDSNRSHADWTRMTDEMVRGINSGSLHAVAYGLFVYNDVLGKTHWIKYCGFANQTPAGQFAPHPQYFAAQEKCMKYNDIDHQKDEKFLGLPVPN